MRPNTQNVAMRDYVILRIERKARRYEAYAVAYEMLANAGMMLGVLKSQALLVDDHPLFRSGLATALRSEPDIEVVGEASTAEEAVADRSFTANRYRRHRSVDAGDQRHFTCE